jgi:hypothetical protein
MLTEDLQYGQVIDGILKIINPFKILGKPISLWRKWRMDTL